eukprot:COSAG01_NODE_35_length_34814_cov_128.883624_33_plen_114_part_00
MKVSLVRNRRGQPGLAGSRVVRVGVDCCLSPRYFGRPHLTCVETCAQTIWIMDRGIRGWRSDDIKIFDGGGGNTHTHIVVSICKLVSLLLSGRGYASSGTGFSATNHLCYFLK